MQEEVTQKSIALVIRTSKLTADVLKKAMIAYLNHLKNKQANWHELLYGNLPMPVSLLILKMI